MANKPIKPAPKLAAEPERPQARAATASRVYVSNRWHRRDGNLHGRPPYYLDNATGLLVRPP